MSFTGRSAEQLSHTVVNDGFFPDLSVGDFQRIYRVPAELAIAAVIQQLTLAMHQINAALAADWPPEQHAETSRPLAAIHQPHAEHYLAAVYLTAKAELLHDFETFSRRESAQTLAENRENYQRLLARAHSHLRALQGKPRHVSAALL